MIASIEICIGTEVGRQHVLEQGNSRSRDELVWHHRRDVFYILDVLDALCVSIQFETPTRLVVVSPIPCPP